MTSAVPRPVAKTVLSWPFLVCLGVLLANDWWLKAAYPNAITGKLSDLSGVAVVGMAAVVGADRILTHRADRILTRGL